MIIGFSFAFMIMRYGQDSGSTVSIVAANQTDVSSFEAPWKNIVKTMAMSMGEFDTSALYKSFQKDKYSRSIAMIILVLLMMFGTIAMVNLFITVIMSDSDRLQQRVFRLNLVNMAEYAILVEEVAPIRFLRYEQVAETAKALSSRVL